MHDAYIGGRSENSIKCVLHDDIGRKNRTTRYNCRFFCCVTGFMSDFLFHSVVEAYSVLSRGPSIVNLLSLNIITVTL